MMAYIDKACIVMAYIVMAHTVMALTVMAYKVMAYIVMVCIVMAGYRLSLGGSGRTSVAIFDKHRAQTASTM